MSDNKVNIILGMEAAGAIRTLQDVEGALGKVLGVLSSIGVSVGLAALTKEMAMLAARSETLGVVMHQLGRNAGYSTEQSDAYAASLRKTGITILESQQSVAKMISAHINLASSTDLARMAQDAAVIGNINSSESFGRMVDGIQSAQVEVLRTIGINVNFEQSYKQFADQLGKTTAQLSEQEKTQARVNAVLAQAPTIAGAYEASLGTVGKQISSMKRPLEDAEVQLGALFGPVLQQSVHDLTTLLKGINTWAEENKEEIKAWGESGKWAFNEMKGPVVNMTAALALMTGGQLAFNAACRANPYIMAGSAIIGLGTWFSENLKEAGSINQADFRFPDSAYGEALAMAGEPLPQRDTSDFAYGRALAAAGEPLPQRAMIEQPNAEADKKAAKEATDAWKKAFTDLKFASADYYAYRVKQIDAETVGMRKAGVSAITAEQWRNNELKQLDEERAKYEGDLDAKRIEAIKAVHQLTISLHKEADEAKKQELATLASINDYILQATDPQAAAIARVTAEYDRQVQAVMELHDTTTGLSDDEALAKIDDLDRAHAANLRQITTSHEKAVITIDRTWDKGFDRLQDLTGDWLRNQRVSMASVGDMMGNLVLEMVNTWAWGQAQMVFTGGQGGGFSGGNILSTVASLASPGMQGNVGTIAGIYTVGKELLTPGSYAAGLTSLQNAASGLTGLFGGTGGGTASASMLAENFGAGAPGVNGTIQGLSSAALSGWTAGISTFGLDLLNGKDFGYSAGHGASAGGGAWAGATIGSSFGPVGTVVGAILGSIGGGELFESIFGGGGDDPWVRRWYTDLSASQALDGVALNTPADDPMAPLFDQANLAISTYLKQVPLNLRSSVMDAFTEAFGTKSWNSGKEDSYQDIAAELANWLTTTITTDLATATKTALLAAVESSRTKDWSLLDPANAIDLVRLINGEARAMNGGGTIYTGPYLQGLAEQGDVAGVYQMANQYVAAMDQLLNIIDPTRVNSAARALTQIAIQFGAMRDQADGLGIALDLVDQAQDAAIQGLIDRYRQPAADVVASHSGTDLSRGLQLISDWQEQQLKQAEELKERMTADDYTSWLADIVDATKYKIQDLVDALIKSWDEFANALTVGEQSAANPMQRYQLLGAQLSGLGQAALGGDQDAAAAFQTAAGNYLDLSRELNTSALAYAADSGWILGWVNRIKQSVQVETTTVPSTTATAGLARSRSDQASGQEIADLRQELIDMKSVMTAVVTQTQATSQILRRWDLGVPSVQDDTTLWLFSSPNN